MPIQNIDNYLMPNRSQEVAIHKSHSENKIPAEQQNLTAEVQNRAERNLNRANSAEKSDLREDSFDAKDKGKNEYYKKQGKRDGKEKDKDRDADELRRLMMEVEGRSIDIKL